MLAMLQQLEAAYPEMRMDDIEGLVNVSEFKVALEILCDNIVETRGWTCPAQVHRELVALALMLKVAPDYWERMQPY